LKASYGIGAFRVKVTRPYWQHHSSNAEGIPAFPRLLLSYFSLLLPTVRILNTNDTIDLLQIEVGI
jgi:hypothetical protein